MLRLFPGSQVHQLLTLLSVSGEFPVQSLAILGNEQVIKRTVHRLESYQDIRSETTGNIYSGKMLQVSGTRNKRTVRLNRKALPVLNELHPEALGYYLDATNNHMFSGSDEHVWRNHRVAEPLAMCMAADIEFRPYSLPNLRSENTGGARLDYTGYYTARSVKNLNVEELNKIRSTRFVGVMFYPGGCYTVYNTRNAIMKWNGGGELNLWDGLSSLARRNGSVEYLDSALLFGTDLRIAYNTLIESDKTQRMKQRFDRIYHHIHFIPMDSNGIRLLQMLVSPDWRNRLLLAVYGADKLPAGYGHMEYDALWDGIYRFCFFDSDIARLVRFSDSLKVQDEAFEVACFPWQYEFLQDFLGNRVAYKLCSMDDVMAALGV